MNRTPLVWLLCGSLVALAACSKSSGDMPPSSSGGAGGVHADAGAGGSPPSDGGVGGGAGGGVGGSLSSSGGSTAGTGGVGAGGVAGAALGSGGASGTGGSGGAGGARTPVANSLDRINFGDLGSDAASEAAHQMSLAAATNATGVFGQTTRVIAPATSAPGDASKNAALTFTLACDPALQNYLTVKLWGGDTTLGLIYLYDATRGYEMTNYYGQSIPEIDSQEDATPMAPGRFVYVTMPIPLASTQGKTSVSLTLNAAESFSYYGGRTTAQLAAGQTSRPIYSAFSHTDPMLNLMGGDLQTMGTSTAATPLTFNAAYVTSVQQRFTKRIDSYRDRTQDSGMWAQAWGSDWDAAVTAGTVPAQVVGLFLGSVTPTDTRTPSDWLTLAATYTSTGNNNPMLRIDDMGQAFAHNLAPTYYQNSEIRQRIIAALDASFYLQSQNGAFGSLTSWVGLGAAAATTANPQGRLTAAGNAIEGNGTLALGSAFINLSTDATFMTALGANINATLVPGMKRYQAWGKMFSNHVAFLLGRHGSAPNQDVLQARAIFACNQAAKLIDAQYGTTYAIADSMITTYVQSASGVTASSKGPEWYSPGGLSLEVHGIGNGGYDGGYGMNGMVLVVEMAKMLKDAGLETDASHPVRDIALNAVHAFSNFIEPSLTPTSVATLRREECITFRKTFNVGEIGSAASYLAASDFADANALHAFQLERLYGMSPPEWSNGNIDEGQNRMFRWGSAYLSLIQNAITAAGGGPITDGTGVTFLHEAGHADSVWIDPVAGAMSFKQNGQHGFMVLNWRPYGYGDATPYVQPGAVGTLSNVARLHLVTASADRIVTFYLPTGAPTAASTGFSSGGYGGQYLFRYGPYVAALNLGAAASSFTVPSISGANAARDWASGTTYDLTVAASRTIQVPAHAGVLLMLGDSAATAGTASALAY